MTNQTIMEEMVKRPLMPELDQSLKANVTSVHKTGYHEHKSATIRPMY